MFPDSVEEYNAHESFAINDNDKQDHIIMNSRMMLRRDTC